MSNLADLEIMQIYVKQDTLSIGFSTQASSSTFTFHRKSVKDHLTFIKWLEVKTDDLEAAESCLSRLVENIFQQIDKTSDFPSHICNRNFFRNKELAMNVPEVEAVAYDFLDDVIKPRLEELRSLINKGRIERL